MNTYLMYTYHVKSTARLANSCLMNLTQLGVSNDSHVVVYDNNEKFGLFTAPRVWWMFRVSYMYIR